MKQLSHPFLFLSMLTFGLVILLLMITSSHASGDSYTGMDNWEEGDGKVVITSQTIILERELMVDSVLVLENTTLIFNCSYNGEYGIRILPGGGLFLFNQSEIRNAGKGRFTLKVNGGEEGNAVLKVSESTITGCGYPSAALENTGIYLQNGQAEFIDSMIKNGYSGIVISGVKNRIVMKKTEFYGNEIGVNLQWAKEVNLKDCEFSNNGIGVMAVHSSHISITGCSFTDNAVGGVVFDNSSYCEVKSSMFSKNYGGGIGAVTTTHLLIENNHIHDSRGDRMLGTGIRLDGGSYLQLNSNVVERCDIGLMMLHNISDSLVNNLTVRGGRLGLYLYDLHYPIQYTTISIENSWEAGISARYCIEQELKEITLKTPLNLGLNITSSDIKLIDPSVDGKRFVDRKSTVHLFQQFMVETWEKGGSPIPYCDVKVKVDDVVSYASGGYGGNDPQTDENGIAGPITVEYSTITGTDENLSSIRICVRGKGQELSTHILGKVEPVVRFYLRVADLTISDNSIMVIPPEPETYGMTELKLMVSNLGSQGAEATLTAYLISGNLSIDTKEIVAHISLPTGASLIGKNSTFVKGRETKTIRLHWFPDTPGDYTILVFIDREMRIIELRKDNNAAMAMIHITEGMAPASPSALLRMAIPEGLNNSSFTSQSISIPVYIYNEGDISGNIILKVSVYERTAENTSEERIIYHRPFSIPASQGITVSVPIALSTGEIIVNFTLLAEEDAPYLMILDRFFSLHFHIKKAHFPSQENEISAEQERLMYTTATGFASLLIAYLIFSEPARYRFLLLFAPLYMRLSKKDIAEQYARGEILGYIKQNPGESYNNIKRDLGMSNGKLAYHLSVLEKGGHIKSVKDGMYRRYYPRRMRVNPYGRITRVQEEILLRIEETPGISQKDLSALIGLSTATVNYHIRKLSEKGIVRVRKKGIFVHYYLNDMTVSEIMKRAVSYSHTKSG